MFQEFQNISGQDIVDAINECYDGYFQELLVAIGKYHLFGVQQTLYPTTPADWL